ncbi:MAG TPA: DMT family transporter [Actinocrinis sp.]|nr:DMT family transporter [Actinocrinis sp.]
MRDPRTLLAGLSVVLTWASAFPAIRVAAPGLGVAGLSAARLAIAAAALLAVAPFAGIRLPRGRDLPLIAACGLFGMTAYQLLLNWGELTVPAGTSSIIVACAPLVSVAIAVLFLRDRLTLVRCVGTVIALVGVAVVCLARTGPALSHAAWIVVAAAVVQGVYHPMIKPLLRRYSGTEVAAYGMIAGSAMTLPFVPFGWSQAAHAGAGPWLAALYLGLVPSALGFVLWGYAVARLPVSASTSLLYLVPAAAVAIAFVWLGEVPVPSEIVGGLISAVGVVLVGVAPKRGASA